MKLYGGTPAYQNRVGVSSQEPFPLSITKHFFSKGGGGLLTDVENYIKKINLYILNLTSLNI